MNKLSENFSYSNFPILGGVLAAVGASLCCVGPLVLISAGISGASISNLTLLEPYRPILLTIVLAMFGWSGWKIYNPSMTTESGTDCAIPTRRIRRKLIFWVAALLSLVLVSSVYWIPLIS